MKIVVAQQQGIDEALEVLRNGGIVAHATETCYGLACDVQNPNAIERLFAVKQRPLLQPISILFETIQQAKMYVQWNELAEEYESHLPGPLTIILPLQKKIPTLMHCVPPHGIPSTNFAIGVRISPHPIAQALVKQWGSPISTTSANVHRQPNPYSAQDVRTQFMEQELRPDLVLDSGELPEVPPSKVLDLTGDEENVLRN